MELDESLGGQMQKQVTCNQELLEVSLPMLEVATQAIDHHDLISRGIS